MPYIKQTWENGSAATPLSAARMTHLEDGVFAATAAAEAVPAEGPPGTNATITSATAVPLAAGASPTVTLGGTASARSFTFGIPAGAKGDPGTPGTPGTAGTAGTSATITSATVNLVAPDATPSVTLGGTASARTFTFNLPSAPSPIVQVVWDAGTESYPTQAGTAPVGTLYRFFEGPVPYTGPAWSGVRDAYIPVT